MAYETQIKRYDKLYDDYVKKADDDTAKRKAQVNADHDAKLRQAYIGNQQMNRQLNENLTRAGIRGGTTETANLRLGTNYQNQRGALESERAKAINNLDMQNADNKFNYKQQNDMNKNNYVEQREAEDRAIAREDQLKREAELREYYKNRYGAYTSITELNKAYARAKSTIERSMIWARKAFLRDRAHEEAYDLKVRRMK